MIKSVDKDENEVYTVGCDCCSSALNLTRDREKIIEELKKNILVAVEGCALLKIPFKKFVKETIAEEKN